MPAVDRIEVEIVAIDSASPVIARARETITQFSATGGGAPAVVREGAKAAQESEVSFKAFGNALTEVGKAAAGFATGMAIADITADVATHFEEAVTQTERLGAATFQLQSRIGGTAENASALIAVFGRFGIDADTAQRSLVLFDKNLQNALNTPKGVFGTTPFDRVWQQLGVSATEATGQMRPLNDILIDVVDRIHSGLVPADQVGADAQILFGRAGQQLAPILANLSGEEFVKLEQEAQKLGLTLSQDNVNALRQLALANKDTEEAMSGMNIQLGLLVSPFLTGAAKWVAETAKEINTDLKPAIVDLGTALDNLVKNHQLPQPEADGSDRMTRWQNAVQEKNNVLGESFSELGTEAQRVIGLLGPFGVLGGPMGRFSGGQTLGGLGAGGEGGGFQGALDFQARGQEAREARGEEIAQREQVLISIQRQQEAEKALESASQSGATLEKILQQEINQTKRESIALSTQIAEADLANIPIKERQSELAQQLLVAGNQQRVLEEQAAVARAQLAAAPAQQALEDAQFRQRELQAQIAASVSGGLGVPAGAIQELIANARARPTLDLAALEAGRGVTLAEREQTAAQRQTELATLPIREEQAALAIVEGQQQLKITMLHDEQQAQKDKAEIAVAGLQAELVALQDINAQLKLRKELQQLGINVAAPTVGAGGGGPQLNIQFGDFTINSQMDMEDVQNQLQSAIVDGFNQAMKLSPNTAGQGQPGGRNQVATEAQ
jgi:hypothetical protein